MSTVLQRHPGTEWDDLSSGIVLGMASACFEQQLRVKY